MNKTEANVYINENQASAWISVGPITFRADYDLKTGTLKIKAGVDATLATREENQNDEQTK